jgi:hypothetical protein
MKTRLIAHRRLIAALVGCVTLLNLWSGKGVSGVMGKSAQTATQNLAPAAERVKRELFSLHGGAQQARIERGIKQVAQFWRPEDGDAEAFARFMHQHFIADPAKLNATFEHFQYALEQIGGYMNEIGRELRHWTDLDVGPILPIDQMFAAYEPSAHLADDFFKNKIAFVVLANFPLTALEERLREGPKWTRRQWAEARLAQRFSRRIPAEVQQDIAQAVAAGETYIAEYNIWMHHALAADGRRLFPKGLRLITHWNLRDELKADYAEPDGLAKQRLIAKIMERIVTQTIPQVVINNPTVDWLPDTNEVRPAPPDTIEGQSPKKPEGSINPAREPNTRYAHLLATFKAARKEDAYSPNLPTLIARRFDEQREIPEARVEQMLKQIMTSPLVPQVARLIEQRLGRKLEPFDIWYNGFLARSKYPESKLDAIVRKKYPNAQAYAADMPRLLVQLGFTPRRARYLAQRIAVDPSRGAGHALGALRRGDKPRLRTRIEKDGMNYKGYNIAVHEMGHNVEQVFSLYNVDYTLLTGVPNNAFTEALAFVFQNKDLELLGLSKPDPASERLRVLNDFWATFEIAGPALVDMTVWRWMYDHPEATPAALREATIKISEDIWNQYYAPVFGAKDVALLGIYSHMVNLMMYLPDYVLGHLIAFQIEEHLKGKNLGKEFERMASFGSVTPDLWMVHATGSPLSAEPLLNAAGRALRELSSASLNLSPEFLEIIEESRQAFKEGRTLSLEEMKEEISKMSVTAQPSSSRRDG